MGSFYLLSILFSLTSGSVIPYSSSSGGGSSYDAGGGFTSSSSGLDYASNSGGDADLQCTPYFETVYENKCQRYTDRVCTTQHMENCFDVHGENCKAILASKQVRKCFNVTELLCSLKEDVEYEVIQATITVQNCHKINERVCDTVYKTQFTNKDDYKCIELSNVHCTPQEQTLQDKTCKTTTEFDCQEEGGGYSSGLTQSGGDTISSSFSGSSSGSGGSAAYGSGGGSAYGSGGGYSAAPKNYYEEPKIVCKKSIRNNCYNTPRIVTSEKCDKRTEKKCEKFGERNPYPVEKQHCHNEEKKVCDLESKTQPKQVKKYVYSRQCRPIRRTICENADVKDLVQSCAPVTHKTCTYTPQDKCVDVPKEHCHKVPRKVQKQKCETVYKKDSYDDSSYSASDAYTSGDYDSGSDTSY